MQESFLEGKVVRGILIIVGAFFFLMAVAGYYLLTIESYDGIVGPLRKGTAAPDAVTNALIDQSSSDEVAVIAGDLESTDLSDLDKELQQIESELNQ